MSDDFDRKAEKIFGRTKDGQIPKAQLNAQSHIGKVIAVVSGKGGVGKSTVTGLLARDLKDKGHSVGILDADITGPSIPKMFGAELQAYAQGDLILPNVSPDGIELVSSNMLVQDHETPVLWRGPVLSSVVQQFYSDVKWGDLDYLLIDMPPGTGDIALTCFQTLPVDGIIVVTTPQELVSMIVMKAVNMAKMMNIPILGVVENMSYVSCPHCGEKIEIYGSSSLPVLEAEKGLKALDALPVIPNIAQYADEGKIFEVDAHLPKATQALEELTK